MHIDLLNPLRSSRELSRDESPPRSAPATQGLADAVVEHLALHPANSRLREALAQWGNEHGSAGGQSRFGWQSPQGGLAAEVESPLNLVLTDILEEINGGTGSNLEMDSDDAYGDEDLFRDLAQMFAHRRQPIGDNDVDSQSDFGNANNPFCGALFGAWETEGAGLQGRRDARLLLLLKLLAVLGRRKLLTLLDIDDDEDQARYGQDDQDLLLEIAGFMDQHPVRYPPPATFAGEPWTWTGRIARGTPLDARETRLFQLALEQLDFALARLAGQRTSMRHRAKRSREEIEFHLSVTDSARNVLRLMCA